MLQTRKRFYGRYLILLLALTVTAQADEVAGLYEAEVEVASQDKELRNAAVRTALEEVLVRVSGRSAVVSTPDLPSIQAALETSTRFAQQFRYRALPVEGDPIPGQSSQLPPKQVLWVRFDELVVNKLLRSNGLPVWGRTRPVTLVWLVVDNRGRRNLIGNSSRHEASNLLRQHAKRRGLPLRLPLLDLADRSSVRVTDVWGNFEDTILRASSRYQPEAILVGRVFQSYTGLWNARWTLYLEGRRHDWEVQGAALSDVVHPGIDQAAESLALRFAQVLNGDASGSVLVQVKGINGLAGYNRAIKYLGSLAPVTQVHPHIIDAKSVIFRLAARSGRLGIAQAVALGHTLVSEPYMGPTMDAGPATGDDMADAEAKVVVADLVYRLLQP